MSNTPKQEMPEWFDGKKINEILFCEAFRKEHPMICIKTMVTLEGKMDLEWKGKQSEQRMMYCRFLCFGNGPLLALYDRTHGFHRRQLLLSVRDRDASRVDDP